MKISFVLPIKLSSSHPEADIFRLIQINARSIAKFCEPSLLNDYFVIGSANDLALIRERARRELPDFPFVFIEENKVCPSLRATDDGLGWQGWHKQQVLKLAMATLVRTEYYMTLDDDVFLTRNLAASDLLRNEKLILSRDGHEIHRHWYQSCCEILKCPYEVLRRNEFVMGVTPEILISEFVFDLHREIQELWSTKDYRRWLLQAAGIGMPLTPHPRINRLVSRFTAGRLTSRDHLDSGTVQKCRDWTEYSLYWTFLQKHELVGKYYASVSPELGGNFLWTEEEVRQLDLEAWARSHFQEPHEYFFSVFTSRIGNVDRQALYQTLNACLR
jgi:hypothetical protein